MKGFGVSGNSPNTPIKPVQIPWRNYKTIENMRNEPVQNPRLDRALQSTKPKQPLYT